MAKFIFIDGKFHPIKKYQKLNAKSESDALSYILKFAELTEDYELAAALYCRIRSIERDGTQDRS